MLYLQLFGIAFERRHGNLNSVARKTGRYIFSGCDAQLNMDVIEKRVSGNERVYNWRVEGPE